MLRNVPDVLVAHAECFGTRTPTTWTHGLDPRHMEVHVTGSKAIVLVFRSDEYYALPGAPVELPDALILGRVRFERVGGPHVVSRTVIHRAYCTLIGATSVLLDQYTRTGPDMMVLVINRSDGTSPAPHEDRQENILALLEPLADRMGNGPLVP